MGTLARVAVTAVGYFVAGKVALLLAIPPGYATAVWPAAGLGLTAVLLVGPWSGLGVLLGSFAVNVTVSSGSALGDAAVALGIAAGASLQALAGAALVRRTVTGLALERPRDIGAFLALGGPVSCCLNAVLGPAVLLAAGRIDSAEYAFSAWTWWAGDTIGVLTASPLLLVAFAEPRTVWRARVVTVAAPLVVTLCVAVVAFVATSRAENRRLRAAFEDSASVVGDALRHRLAASIDVVSDVASLRQSHDDIDQTTFVRFTSLQRATEGGIQALSWNPRLAPGDLQSFEALARDTHPGYRVHPAPSAATAGPHFPVFLLDPVDQNRVALGFDLWSEGVRRRAIERAIAHGRPVVSERVRLIQERENQAGFLIVVPTFRLAGGERALDGIAVGVFRRGDFLEAALRGVDTRGLTCSLEDTGTPSVGRRGEKSEFELELSMQALGAPWSLRVAATAGYLAAARSWLGWGVLAAGLLFAALLGGLLLVVTGRAASIERLVEERTRALTEADALSRDERRKFERLLEAAPDPVLIIDEAGVLVLVNEQAEKAFGYHRGEIVGRPVEMLLPERARASHQRHRAAYFRRPALRPMGAGLELAGRRKDGSEFPVDISLSPIEVADGMLVTAAIRDVTEQRRAHRTLELLREVAVLANEASSVDDALRACLRRLCEHLGWSVGHVYVVDAETGNLHPTSLWYVAPGFDAARFRQHTATTTFAAGQGLPGGVLEYGCALAYGDLGERSASLRRNFADAGLQSAFAFPVLVGREVTHVVELFDQRAIEPPPELPRMVEQIGTQLGRVVERARAQEHRIYAEALERSNQELQLFAHVASHDLREPLRMVTSFLGLFRERYGDGLDERATRYVQHAFEGAERMDAMIRSLLVYSRLDSRGSPPRATGAAAALDQAIANLAPRVAEAGARIERGDLPVVMADEAQLVQVFQNLLSNALKFRSGDHPSIRVSAVARGPLCEFSVADDGIGIDMAYAQRIFEIFQRLHTREEYPGTGIGLSICKRIVERHGGRIWVESMPGRGSTFHFTMRAAGHQEDHDESDGEAARAAG